ncbi:structural maintenance of chromosomes protein 4 isoform X1 [Neodiprion fabricii]|uniref:structural maintenance of chromosomes protein 4 isoform X1 n=1 Tax=Neodiprion fabricii TaxID=2872261 RepID=UPI001ED8D523|nr:structural maintenance of chromosomes protein 4 isoform X1 [Neodiprion fabricii]XP_046426200.1 structural maintenance of chromosomes protein 4 isoform X1 [Neodiprion fabricii]
MAGRNQCNSDYSDEEMETEPSDNGGVDSDDEGGVRIDADIYIPPPPKPMSEVDENGPRIMITKIVNNNFKSYAGKQVIGPFHKCFSAIIGPNGSGKSNVIDSMLFVFGYRASKIRSKKISVLIHNSSEHPNCSSCTVAVHFQTIIDKPGHEYDIVPNSEIVISRTAFKDNSSFYQLNGRKVQFKEVAKVLRQCGVDLDYNRFLILQGEVEQIAMMKPKGQTSNDTGMLEFLEDIIGTVRYKEPLEKLSQKIELLTENRVEHLNRLQVVEKEKEELEEPMQHAVRYLKCENKIAQLQHQLYHCKRLRAQDECTQQELKKTEMDKDYQKLQDEMSLVKTQKNEKQAEMKEKCKKWDALQNRKDQLTAKYEEIKKKDEQLHAELVETNKRRKANMATVKTEKEKLESLSKVPEKNAKDIAECEGLHERCIADREKAEATLATLMNGLKKKTEPLLEQRRLLETELMSLRKNVDQARGNLEIAQSSLRLYTSAEVAEKAKLEELQESLKNTNDLLRQRKEQIKVFDIKIPATEKSLVEAQREFDMVKQRDISATAQLRNTRIRVEEQRSAMNASKSRNRVLDSLMQQKRQGNIPGIRGRLGDLGAIDSKYDVAISTACGPLDNILVDTVDTARRCIAFLRQNDIGRATFIALEKQQRLWSECRERIATPENVPRLFDLIRVEDEEVLPAFYYGLRNTLVARDLDQATRIAYGEQRHRVVTLKGELIETSGTMSGGGRTSLQGRMGQSIVRAEPCAADVEKLQVDLDKIYEECNQLKDRQHQLEPQIDSLSRSLVDMKMDREKYSIEVQSLTKQKPSLESQLKIQEKKAAESVSNPNEVKKMTKAVKSAEKELEEAENDSKSTENEVVKINQQIEEIAGGKVKSQQKSIADLSKKIDKTRGEICRLQVAIKTAERDSKKVAQHIETLETSVRTCENKIREIQQEKVCFETNAKELLGSLNEVTEELVERDENLATFKAELNAFQERENKMKAVKIELDQQVKEMNKVLESLQQKIPEYTRKISSLKLQPIPGETVLEFAEIPEEEVRQLDPKMVAELIEKTKARLPAEIPNMQLIKEYFEKDALYVRRVKELEEITTHRNKLRDIFEDSRRRRTHEFLTGFLIITSKLKEMYQMITLGGDAELELVDSLDPFNEGIVFSVRPPKKSWKNISNLSGGEKTLSSLALVFALHHYKPTPLYFMDEIDAALDFKNVSIVGNYIKERTKNAQFIVISLRSNMFELADYLVGIYKTYNCTKCAILDVGKYCDANNIHLPTPNLNKDYYSSSQGSKPYSQSIFSKQNTNTKENRPTIIPESSSSSSSGSSVIDSELSRFYRLPELGLCPSPKTSITTVRDRRSTEIEGSTDGAHGEPTSKRRKL